MRTHKELMEDHTQLQADIERRASSLDPTNLQDAQELADTAKAELLIAKDNPREATTRLNRAWRAMTRAYVKMDRG